MDVKAAQMLVVLKIFTGENIKLYDTNSFKMYRIRDSNSTFRFLAYITYRRTNIRSRKHMGIKKVAF